jgi:hypothetical protein
VDLTSQRSSEHLFPHVEGGFGCERAVDVTAQQTCEEKTDDERSRAGEWFFQGF